MAVKLYESKLWMRRQYIDNKKTPQQIADMCKCNELTIRRWLLKHQLRRSL